jgi:hypothetical protein
VEGYFLARLFMYQQVYFHKATRAAEACCARSSAASPTSSPTAACPKAPPALAAFARAEPVSTHDYLSLDDNAALVRGRRVARDRDDAARHPVGAHAADATCSRPPRSTTSTPSSTPAMLAGLEAIVGAHGFDPRYFAALDVAEVLPFERPRRPMRGCGSCYARRPPQALEHASFIIARIADTSFVRRRLVFPAAVREAVTEMLEAQRPGR